MKVSNHYQANGQTLKITPQSSKTSPYQEEKQVQRKEEAKFQNAIVAKIKELNHKVSTLQGYEKTLSLIQEEIAELESIKSQISANPNTHNLTHRLDTLKNRLKPMLTKINNPLLEQSNTPTLDQVLKNPQKYEQLALKNQEKAQILLKECEEKIENMFEKNVDFDEKMLCDVRFKNTHNLARLTSNYLLLTQ